jgi:hypothetical protein
MVTGARAVAVGRAVASVGADAQRRAPGGALRGRRPLREAETRREHWCDRLPIEARECWT